MRTRTLTTMVSMALLATTLMLPAGAQVGHPSEIVYPELPEFDIPAPEVYTLDNGLTVFLMEDHELPLISVTARIRTGSNYVPADKEGMAGIFGQAQREGGTASMPGDEMDDFLEARAASIETGMGGDSASASMNCLKEDFDDVFRLFGKVLREPAFEQSKIDLAKLQANTGIARRNDNVGGIIGREFRRLVYGPDTPLGRMAEYATVASVTRDDLLAWHARYYHPNNVYLGVVGDFDSKRMVQEIQRVFGDWKRGPDFDAPEVPIRRAPAGVYFIEKEDVTQANVRLGHLGIEVGNPDYFAVQVMNEVLGGGFAARLFSKVRTEKGLAYSVFGGIGASFLRPGVFQVGLSTKSETMGEAVDALKEEIRGMLERPPSDDEMSRAKESILNAFVFNYTSRAQILGQQMTYAYFGLPADFLEKYRANIEKVSKDDVVRVARKYIKPGDLTLLVVGKAEEFDRPMDSFGAVTTLDISIPDPPDTRAQIERSTDNLEAGARLLDRMAAKIGPAVHSVKAEINIEAAMAGQKLAIDQSLSYVFPDKLWQQTRLPFGEQMIVVNGERGLMSAGGQQQALPAEQIAEMKKDLGRDLMVIAGHADSPDLEAVAAGADEVGGLPCDLVEVSFLGASSRLCIDAAGTVLGQSYNGKHPLQGTPGLVELTYADWRAVDGRTVPFEQVMYVDGEQVFKIAVESIEFDVALDEALFEVAGE